MRVRSAIRWAIPGLCAGLLGLPAAASAGDTGGATAPPPAVGATGLSGPLVTGGTLAVVPASLFEGQATVASGSLPAAAGGAVLLQLRTRRAWTTVASGLTGPGGSFAVSWRARRPGELTLRAVSAAASRAKARAATASATATPEAVVSVYAPVIATWYGPGFYGQRTACGETMSRQIVGVAARMLPCGTPVALSYNGQTLVVPVIDRGPYGTAATLDLTHAAAQELGITETVPIGMIALSGPALAPSDWYPPGSPSGSSGATGPAANAGGATAPSG